MRAALDLKEQAFNDIGGPDRLPVGFGEVVKGQTSLQIAVQTLNGGGVKSLIFFDKSGHFLIGLLAVVLVENGLQFRFDPLLLFFGDVAQDIVHFVFDTALAGTVGKVDFHSINHGLEPIGDPQAHFLDPTLFEIGHQVFPSQLVFSLSDPEGQDSPSGVIPTAAKMGILCPSWS